MYRRRWSRRSFLKTVGYGTTGAVLPLGIRCSKRRRPNILFIFSDDHARHAVSAYGGRLARIAPTPNIDRIAEEGCRFDRCGVTNSICAPSRATILTGKYSHLNGVRDNRDVFDGSQPTFPKMLNSAGYETAIIGKWHLKTDPTGFDHWDILPGQGHYYNPDFITPGGRVQETGYVTDIITDKALHWIDHRRYPDRPFCLMVHHKAPHRAWEPGPDHLELFDGVTIPEPDNLFDDYEGRGTAARKQDMSIEATMQMDSDLKVWQDSTRAAWKRSYGRMNRAQRALWDGVYGPENEVFLESNPEGQRLVRWKYQRYMKDYLRCIASIDDNVGRLLERLDRTGLGRQTVVIYSSDQGFFLGEHGWFDKRFMYEESYRIPLVIRWPGVVEPGSVNDDLVLNLDFAPTFLDIAGCPIPTDMQGKSMLPILTVRSEGDWREGAYYHYYEYPAVHSVRRHEGVATRRYKLMHFYDLNEWELYDLVGDPREMRNLYGDPEFSGTVEELKALLRTLRNRYELPPNEPISG